ncbi:TIGR01841 family phasin [Sphingosinicella sp.]|uniref:phasin family protein n=1 Tax=Sphingosinicella sp. TaxID=1917971 RepID=UPI0035ADF91E
MAEAAKVEVKVEPVTAAPAKPAAAPKAETAPAVKVEAKPAPKAAAPTPVAKPKVSPKVAAKVVAKPVKPAPAKVEAKVAKAPAPKAAKPKTVAPAAVSAKASVPPKQKAVIMTINENVKKQTETAMAQGKAAVEQFQTKTREALDKSTKAAEELGSFTRENVEAFVESGKIAAKGFETLTQSAIELAKKNGEAATTAFKSFSSAKSANELLQLQSDFARTQFDKFIADSSKMTEAFVKLSNDVFEPISSRFAVAADKFKTAAVAK